MELHDSTFIDAYMFHKILDLCKGWLAEHISQNENIKSSSNDACASGEKKSLVFGYESE